jgi:hypothetical protein
VGLCGVLSITSRVRGATAPHAFLIDLKARRLQRRVWVARRPAILRAHKIVWGSNRIPRRQNCTSAWTAEDTCRPKIDRDFVLAVEQPTVARAGLSAICSRSGGTPIMGAYWL